MSANPAQSPAISAPLLAPSWHLPAFWVTPLNLLLACFYALTGHAGLQLAFIGDAVTLFWPPTGLAFAAVWLGGLRLLPGVIAGAFAVNLFTLGSPAAALAIAIGNMLPALASHVILHRAGIARPGLSQIRQLLWFLLVPVLGATMLSASVGTGVLELTGRNDGAAAGATWVVWWLGDAMGVLIVAPPLLLMRSLWRGGLPLPGARGLIELLAFVLIAAALILALHIVHGPIWAVELCKLGTLLLGLTAAARFGMAGAAYMTSLIAVGATAATVLGVGPFVRGDYYDRFALLHSYLSVQAVAALLLAAVLGDLGARMRGEREALRQAQSAAAERVRLLSLISHDIRTPLNGILGVLQALQRLKLPPAGRALADMGLRAGRTLTTLLGDIIDIARADAGRMTLHPQPFDPGLSLADLAALQRPLALEKGLYLETQGLDQLPGAILADKARFEQLIGNLIANAVAYTASGGIAVRARWSQELSPRLQVEVIDTGPGVPAELADALFDGLLHQPHHALRSAGLGLGLGICKRIARLMGGNILYRPREGGGSIFHVELPVTLAEAPPPVAAAESPSWRILLVEDDPIGQTVTAALLRLSGHQVSVTGDGASGLAALQEGAFDAVLMDIHLGSPAGAQTGSGIDAARAMRALQQRLCIVALTADAQTAQNPDYVSAGFNGLLLKPLMVDEAFAQTLTVAMAAARG